MRDGSQALECPTCAELFSPDKRFCPSCGTPLVYGGEAARGDQITERQERARKIKPQFAEGKLVHVVGVRNQAEGEFIQALLLEEGVPSLLRRSAGFDVPDFLAAGPRDVLVPESGEVTAREILLQAELISADQIGQRVVAPGRLLAGLLAGIAVVIVVIWVGTLLLH